MENTNQQPFNTETTIQNNTTNPNSTKPHTKGITIFSSIISYISVPFLFFILISYFRSIGSDIIGDQYWLETSVVDYILAVGITFLPPTILTIIWLIISTILQGKIYQGSRRTLVILLAISIYIIITGNLLIYSNK
ncbi:MAG: hypothetical protein HYT07_01575 [Candidatus Levybacteria bacterium]|nr:hypothetical protein [Candidatus Levybacteria bacterium]